MEDYTVKSTEELEELAEILTAEFNEYQEILSQAYEAMVERADEFKLINDELEKRNANKK